MAHGHTHHEEESGRFWHHQAEYNIEKIIRNLLLIQDHYSQDPCADCLSKHWNLVMAYAEEGETLDGSEKYAKEFNEVIGLGERHIKIILDCAVGGVCKVKKPEDMQRMIQEVRVLRKELNQKIYGLVGDVTHDILVEQGKLVGEDVSDHEEDHVVSEHHL